MNAAVLAHATRAHASLGASAAYRWSACPGSVRLSAEVDGESGSTVYAREGTAAHELCEMCLNSGRDAIEFIDREIGEFTVDEEMAEAVQVYLDAVRAVKDNSALMMVEKKFSLDALLAGTALQGLMFGTNDCCVVTRHPELPGQDRLYVYDYKHGRGVAVEVKGNLQLRYYALGASLALSHHPIADIEIVIVQPRARHPDGPVRRETVTPYELVEWSADLVEAAERTLQPDAPLIAGEHCGWCPAQGFCPAARDASLAVAKMQFQPLPEQDPIIVPPAPETLTPEQIGRILDKAEVVKDWIEAVKADAHLRLDRGIKIPGWKLVQKRATRKWASDDETTAASLDLMGLDIDQIYVSKIRTVAQVEKSLPKGQRAALEALYVKESSGTTIAREGDSRAALPDKASADFSPLDQPEK